MLSSRFPSGVFWGPELIQLYNDAYLPLMAEKDPKALGQAAPECWKEAWHIIRPQFEAVLDRGESIFQEDVIVPVIRQGKLQDVYWTYSYSPIFSSAGAIAGVLIVCQDVTAAVVTGRERDALAGKLQQVFDVTTDAIVSVDREWRLTFLNRKAKELVAPSGDVLGTIIWESFPGHSLRGISVRRTLFQDHAAKPGRRISGVLPGPTQPVASDSGASVGKRRYHLLLRHQSAKTESGNISPKAIGDRTPAPNWKASMTQPPLAWPSSIRRSSAIFG